MEEERVTIGGTYGIIDPSQAVGVFDSGVGGLSVLAEIRRQLPGENILYFADTKHMPYGSRPLSEVRSFSQSIIEFFLSRSVKLVVVACNTASAAALKYLRQTFPHIPFVGMEPAVKPAAAHSRSGKVGVLATQATFQGELFESVVDRFAKDVTVIETPCPGLAEYIERAPNDTTGLEQLLRCWIDPLLEQGIDSLVLGCTHYPLVKETIQRVAGENITIFDPSIAIARRVRQVLGDHGGLTEGQNGMTEYFASGDINAFTDVVEKILLQHVVVSQVEL